MLRLFDPTGAARPAPTTTQANAAVLDWLIRSKTFLAILSKSYVYKATAVIAQHDPPIGATAA
jgi:hypothetical protein